jgi:hypothetical protein
MNIRDFAEKFISAEDEVWKHGNFSLLEKLEASNIVVHMMSPFSDIVGWEAHKGFLNNTLKSATDVKQEWKYLTGDGKVFSLAYKSFSRYPKGRPDMGFPVGAKVSADAIWVLRTDAGKVIEAWLNGSFKIEV